MCSGCEWRVRSSEVLDAMCAAIFELGTLSFTRPLQLGVRRATAK